MPTTIDRDLPLKEDTRLLGRLLGDVLRSTGAKRLYARRSDPPDRDPVSSRRSGSRRRARELSALLNDLSIPPRSTSSGRFRISRISRISPKTFIRTAARARTRRIAAATGQHRAAWRISPEAGVDTRAADGLPKRWCRRC
jgi:hypothetical protein